MPIAIPRIDDRRYQDLLEEAVARISIHNPEWTNFNPSDPGITLIELFAFLTENLLYRSNQIPERNRKKFLQLLGVPLRTAVSARGMVSFANARGPLQTLTLNAGLEVRAGEVPFRTEQGLDVLPIDVQFFFKRERTNPPPEETAYYTQLYASFVGDPPRLKPKLYEVVAWTPGAEDLDLGTTVDGSLWVALLARTVDKPLDDLDGVRKAVRQAIGGKALSLGIAPALTETQVRMVPGGPALPPGGARLLFEMPSVPADGALPPLRKDRVPRYQALASRADRDVLAAPATIELPLPRKEELGVWENLDPLEAGVGDFPPTLEDTEANERIVTWLRIRTAGASPARLHWVGINAATVTQRLRVADEILRDGTGEPDQVLTLSKRPVLPRTARVTTLSPEGRKDNWQEIEDLYQAGPEVPVDDGRPPGSSRLRTGPVFVFLLDPEAGHLRFGDGQRGARPLGGMRADYEVSMGALGNVGPGAIDRAAALPAGITVTNPLRTWGGADAETVREGERQITRFLQHRDRLVTAQDFESIARRAGVPIGRLEVIPAYNPALAGNEPGDAPGAVTLMVIPRFDAEHPDAPEPDGLFLEALCRYLEPRRLITTELLLRPPDYKDLWVTVGIDLMGGYSFAPVREDVRRALTRWLSPLPADPDAVLEAEAALLTGAPEAGADRGWPLRKPVDRLELAAVVSRVPGVRLVKELFVAEGSLSPADTVPMAGLQLPRVRGIEVAVGDAPAIDELRGRETPATTGTGTTAFVPVPVIPEEC